VGPLSNADTITEGTFWVGVYPGLSSEMIDYIVSETTEFVAAAARAPKGSHGAGPIAERNP
jgi:dTDP-4-amino-4,6-dideoxygalactose transaminase